MNLLQHSPQRIFLRSNKKYTQLEINAILYIEASGNYTKVVTNSEGITIREKISSVSESLPEEGFVQVHKSFIVAVQYIKSIEGNRIIVRDRIIPIGKMYKSNVLKLIK